MPRLLLAATLTLTLAAPLAARAQEPAPATARPAAVMHYRALTRMLHRFAHRAPATAVTSRRVLLAEGKVAVARGGAQNQMPR